MFKGPALPFGFKYGGKDSKDFLGTWQTSDSTAPAPDGNIRTYIYSDPATQLKVTCAVRTFDKFDAVDWVLTFSNGGAADTPIIENIQPLQWTVGCDSPGATVHTTRGSTAGTDDFAPVDMDLQPNQSHRMGVGSGRSSDGGWPFFNLQTGDHGLYGAIGWTGDWQADFNRAQDGKSIAMDGGHAGDASAAASGRDDPLAAHLADELEGRRRGDGAERVAPADDQRILAARTRTAKFRRCRSRGTRGGPSSARSSSRSIQGMAEQKIPADLYWIDAGWYPPIG